ncbi:unnamed protein product [Bemisia tabaci]|uniref:Uncharacterized protein n=1 Tax=Bemisia tabaci TaxID=7038 RepID=A0A9P0AGR2_BEMTA|nr:unnamed protein product [Bemisia tabaci]
MRMNEFLKSAWYTGFRLTNVDFARLLIRDREQNRLRVDIRATSILAFFRSVNTSMRFGRNIPIQKQMSLETRTLMDMMSLFCVSEAADRLLTLMGLPPGTRSQAITNSDFWKWAKGISVFGKAPTSPIMQHIEYLLHRRISVDRSILASVQPQRWVVLVRDFVQYYIQRSVLFGVAPGFYYIRDGMRCVSLPSLNFFVSGNRMWTNTERFMLTNNRKVYNPVNAVMQHDRYGEASRYL